ncbi:BspA family leucine-rich repeat surface protein [Cyclobacterium plantarum]|uniref:BspA family leucine-rich repeat surface protein n=1 Tax=Cyclobacterium plantarum TaxID=2716263 RepID=UPI003F7109FC
MKKLFKNFPLHVALALVALYSCEQGDQPLSPLQGSIRFGGISLVFSPMGSPESRVTANSPWVHVFPNSANLVFIAKTTGQQFVLEYDPNDFSVPYSISLPYGDYEYHSVIEGGIFSDFLPYEAKGEVSLASQSLEISLKAETDYGLVTVKNQYLEKASFSDGERESDLVVHPDSNYWYSYVKRGTKARLNIRESLQRSTISRELNIEANRHYNFILEQGEGAAVIRGLILAAFDLEEEEILLGLSTKFFEKNGIIKCPGAVPGEKGMINDKMYQAVDRTLLIQMRDQGADLTCVCTSPVTDMNSIFYDATSFNQPIGNWDVSNVTNMKDMFHGAISFNQPIGNWDVSNVRDMGYMFRRNLIGPSSFNQSIENWDVSNVTNMYGIFLGASDFNQPLCNWDVSSVTNMASMFSGATSFNQSIEHWDVSNVTFMDVMFSWASNFNQPIGNWDVSNVKSMSGIFSNTSKFNQPLGNWDVGNVIDISFMFSYATSFNQPIGNWDVGNATDMSFMFSSATSFNQPIGDWDVSEVTSMYAMFWGAEKFNQNLNSWCVQNITSEPTDFSKESALLDTNKPVWGTCSE